MSATIAEHRLAAAAGSADDGASRAADAARDALAGAALEEAVTWARHGLRAATDDGVRADLHRVAGVAERRAGRFEASEAALRQEAAIARRPATGAGSPRRPWSRPRAASAGTGRSSAC